MTSSALSGNTAGRGSGIYNYPGSTATPYNTIVANATSGGNCVGAITDVGHSIDDGPTCALCPASGSLPNIHPRLGPLAENGGPTLTHALL